MCIVSANLDIYNVSCASRYIIRNITGNMYIDLLKQHTILNGEINTKLRKTQMNKLKKTRSKTIMTARQLLVAATYIFAGQ